MKIFGVHQKAFIMPKKLWYIKCPTVKHEYICSTPEAAHYMLSGGLGALAALVDFIRAENGILRQFSADMEKRYVSFREAWKRALSTDWNSFPV
jgi:hypothetical protein